MPPDAAQPDPETTPNTHGGRRAGAGAPRGPRPETVARLARLREIAAVDEHGEDVSGLSNLDIVQIQVWRLWGRGEFRQATELALRLLPYHHSRKPTVTVTRAEPAAADAPPPARGAEPDPDPDPEPLPPLPRAPKPRPDGARLPRAYDHRIERKLEKWVIDEFWRRERTPDTPTAVPPFWHDEVEARLFYRS